MATSLELPDDLLAEIRLRASREGRGLDDFVIDLLRKALAGSGGEALTVDDAMLEARRQLAEKFVSGEWGAELSGFEAARAADRDSATARERAWRG
jgi:plasmid stability protein